MYIIQPLITFILKLVMYIHVCADYFVICTLHDDYLTTTHMQTLRAAVSHATMENVYPTAIDVMEMTIAMTTVMKRDAVSHLL